jgi:hypothetical protein
MILITSEREWDCAEKWDILTDNAQEMWWKKQNRASFAHTNYTTKLRNLTDLVESVLFNSADFYKGNNITCIHMWPHLSYI